MTITATLDLLPALTPAAAPVGRRVRALSDKTAELAVGARRRDGLAAMMRQTQQMAGRRLRAARDVAGRWRREAARAHAGALWSEHGGWDARLRERRCAAVCKRRPRRVRGDDAGGWRERLLAGAAATVRLLECLWLAGIRGCKWFAVLYTVLLRRLGPLVHVRWQFR